MIMATNSTTEIRDSSAMMNQTRNTAVIFKNSIRIKLDINNFLVWCKQVLETVRGYDLEEFPLGTGVPMKYAEPGDEELERLSPEFCLWQRLLVIKAP